jgi:hypothetical protein
MVRETRRDAGGLADPTPGFSAEPLTLQEIPMLTISLKDEIQKVLSREWLAFAQDHPNLAAVIDRTLLFEQAAACLQDDAEYREALELASAAGASASVVVDLIERFVVKWLKTLV